jgi:transposase
MKTVTSSNPNPIQETASLEALFHRLSLLEEENVKLDEGCKILNEDNKNLKEENSQLHMVIRYLRQQQFGRKSEKMGGDLPLLPAFQNLFDEPGIDPKDEPEAAAEQSVDQEKTPAKKKKKGGRRPLPKDLPREVIIHDLPEDKKTCACCGDQMQKMGEETSEQLDLIPALLRVLVHVRNKYACKSCEEGVTLAPLPAQPIPKSIASSGLLANVLVSKYADHLPLYRQSQMWGRLGIDISRSTMSGWVLKCGDLLEPLVDLLRLSIIKSDYVRADETTLQVLAEPNRKATDGSYMWVFMTGSSKNPSIVYRYDPARKGAVAAEFLSGFKGHLQSDAFSGYKLVCKDGITSVGCWAHARRKFVDIVKIVKKPGKAAEAVAIIGKLYDIERYAKENNLPPEKVKELRHEKSKPVLDLFRKWLDDHVGRVPPKNPLCAAMKYSLNNWAELTRYLDDGRLDIDNNACERAIKPFAVGRKNWLFSGNDVGAKASAVIFSLIQTCKANNVEPYTYLKHVLENIHTTDDLTSLLPFNVKQRQSKDLTEVVA